MTRSSLLTLTNALWA